MTGSIALTGGNGFLGWHSRVRGRAQGEAEITVVPLGNGVPVDGVAAAIDGAKRLLHLAGMNRGEPEMVRRVNIELAAQLADGLRRVDVPPTVVVFANSIQARGGGCYGDAKAEAAEILAGTSNDIGAEFVDLQLPNLFGEHGRPFYNSVVATFAHQLASGGEPAVDADRSLTLLHVQDAAEVLLHGRAGDDVEARTTRRTVSELLATLRTFAKVYRAGEIPQLDGPFDVALFNTYRSFTFPDQASGSLVSHRDHRGQLSEAVRCRRGSGQTSFSITAPGVTRGQHFHLSKIERFVVMSGRARIALRRMLTDEVVTFDVSGAEPVFVDIPTMWVHNIANIGDDVLHTLLWTNDLFDPAAPDTYSEAV